MIFYIHNTFCKKIPGIFVGKMRTENRKENIQYDPISLIFYNLKNEPIEIANFQVDLLKRNINLKITFNLLLHAYQLYPENFAQKYHKCTNCEIILPDIYII